MTSPAHFHFVFAGNFVAVSINKFMVVSHLRINFVNVVFAYCVSEVVKGLFVHLVVV